MMASASHENTKDESSRETLHEWRENEEPQTAGTDMTHLWPPALEAV